MPNSLPALVGQWINVERHGNVWKALCPFHNDKDTPSFTVYENGCYCFGCHQFWSPLDFVKQIGNMDWREARDWLSKNWPTLQLSEYERRTPEQYTTPLPIETLQYWHSLLGGKCQYYRDRLITDEMIDNHLLGWDGRAFVIPVWEHIPRESNVYSVRFRRDPLDTAAGPKYWSLKGRGHASLYNKHVLDGSSWAVIFFGEFDALLASQDGLPAVSPTCGQNSWKKEWKGYFSDCRMVYVVPDKGEEQAGYALASQFLGRSAMCNFPDGYKDYTEYRLAGYSVEDFTREVLKK